LGQGTGPPPFSSEKGFFKCWGKGPGGAAVHALRKTAITNALEHGAKMEQVQQLAGHCDIRTTQLYFAPKERDAEEAARHIQIR